MTHAIPLIIHQTWRDSEIPSNWQSFQASWRRFHPEWEYRLWTDLSLRQFIHDMYPWFLPIYDNYPEPIQRVDAARYFLMHYYGGVYVDLDFECLRPLNPLLNDRDILLGFEPEEHFSKNVVRAAGLESVIANAFMASRPGHPFWEHVFLELIRSHKTPDPLSSTGPFMLTRAVQSYEQAPSLTLISSKVLYPCTSEEAQRGLSLDPSWRSEHTSESYAIHHWSGSWIKPDLPATAEWLQISVLDRGKMLMNGQCIINKANSSDELVSCLMVTHSSRLKFVKRAIACFKAQTYPSKELVIVDDGPDEALNTFIKSLEDPEINSPSNRITNGSAAGNKCRRMSPFTLENLVAERETSCNFKNSKLGRIDPLCQE